MIILLFIIQWILGIIFLGYRIPEKLGYPNIGIAIAGLLAGTIFIITFLIVFEDDLFFKSDAKELLREHKIELIDDFEIISNEFEGLGNTYQRFEIRISEKDKLKIINKTMKSDNFQDSITGFINIQDFKPKSLNNETSYTRIFIENGFYIYEFYGSSTKESMPGWDIISVSKSENILIFERNTY